MSRPKDNRKKLDVVRSAPPLHNAFAALDGLDALKNLPAPPPEQKASSVAAARSIAARLCCRAIARRL
jgi:hypothetical protein